MTAITTRTAPATAPVQAPSREEIAALYHSPLLELISRAGEVHRRHHDPGEIQVCVLLSIKTGGCSEDCGYCPQSAHYETPVDRQGMMDVADVLESARRAKEAGATRLCMGAAWREVKDGPQFESVLEMVRNIKDLGGLEVCCTLGMLTEDQAGKLREAGLDAYNHNLDTSPEYYSDIISTRTYQDRLDTLARVRQAGIPICSGGIVGMGETHDDRIGLLHALASLPKPPDSVPINALVPVEGTPLADRPQVEIWDMLRMIATARILFPNSMVRLSAGRVNMSEQEQALCFLAGANSIFAGEKLLTTPNNEADQDRRMFDRLGLRVRPSGRDEAHPHEA